MTYQLDMFSAPEVAPTAESTAQPPASSQMQADILRWVASLSRGGIGLLTRGEWAMRVKGQKYVPCKVMDDSACLWCPLAAVWVTCSRLGCSDLDVEALELAIKDEILHRSPHSASIFAEFEDANAGIVVWLERLPAADWARVVESTLLDAANVILHGRPTAEELEAKHQAYVAWNERTKWTSAAIDIRDREQAQSWIIACAERGGHGWHLFEDLAAIRPYCFDEHRAEQILAALTERGWIVRARHPYPVRQQPPASSDWKLFRKHITALAMPVDFAYGPSEKLAAAFDRDPSAVISTVLADIAPDLIKEAA